MALLIHTGVLESEVDVFIQQVQRLTEGDILPRVSDLKWDTRVPDLKHIIIPTITPMVVINFLAQNFGVFMHPSTDILEGSQTKIIVTDGEDYSEEYIEFRFPM